MINKSINIKQLQDYSLFKNTTLIKLKILKNQGVCNTTYKLEASNTSYLVRKFNYKQHTHTSRKEEFNIQKKAAKKGIAAKPYILDEKKDLLLCDFLKGSHKKNLKNKDIKSLVKTLKKLHRIKAEYKKLNLKKEFTKYKKELKDKTSQKLIYSSLKKLIKLKKYKSEKVVCHHDLNKENILFHQNKVKFIDWEFSCVNDKYFDIASICIEFKLNKKQERYLLKKYLNKIKTTDKKKLKIYKKICSNLWKLWFKKLKK